MAVNSDSSQSIGPRLGILLAAKMQSRHLNSHILQRLPPLPPCRDAAAIRDTLTFSPYMYSLKLYVKAVGGLYVTQEERLSVLCSR